MGMGNQPGGLNSYHFMGQSQSSLQPLWASRIGMLRGFMMLMAFFFFIYLGETAEKTCQSSRAS
jgi:hypothetical protein